MGSQLRIVGTFELKDGKFVSSNTNKQAFLDGNPIQVPVDQISKYYPLDTRSKVTVGTLLNQLTLAAGETYHVPGGRRVILEAKSHQVLFLSITDNKALPRFYLQKPSGFHQAWLDTIRLKAASSLKPVETLAQWEVEFLTGCIAGLGWKGLSLVIGSDILQEALNQRKTESIKRTVRTVQVIFQFKKELREVAPTLESFISNTLWLTLLKGQGNHLLPATLQDPKAAARAAGTIAVQLDRKAVNNRLTASSIIWTICSQFGVKAVVKIPDAVSRTIEEYDISSPENLVSTVEKVTSTLDITLSKEERQAITTEVTTHPKEIAAIFSRMIKALALPPQ